MEHVHVKDNSVNLAYVEMGPIRACEIACVNAELEKAKASALQFIRTTI